MKTRHLVGERMDDPSLDPAAHHHALRGLRRLNLISGAGRIMFNALRDLAPAVGGAKPLRVLDVACGAGDVAIDVWRRGRRAGLGIEVEACDRSAAALDFARAAAKRAGAAVGFFEADALRDPIDAYDVVMCSLFLHHLDDEAAETLLRRMGAAAGRRVLVNDLDRSRMNLLGVWLASRLVTRSRVVHVDGPLSIRAALNRDEARQLAKRAGLEGARVEPRRPCRWLLRWDRK